MFKRAQKTLSVATLTMITVAAIVNLRNLPFMASVGLESIFFYLVAAIVFLIPSAFICAELSSSLTDEGGVYLWVKRAFGNKLAFFAIWSEWFNNLMGAPATLSFIAGTLAFILTPHLAENRFYLFFTILIIGWGVTLFNFLDIKISSRLNILGALLGTIVPAIIIIALASLWLFKHNPTPITFNIHHLFPPLKIKSLVFFVGVLSAYAGMQITAFHIKNVKDPKHDFPKTIILSVIIILAITILSSLAIALVVPSGKLSLVDGFAQGFSLFFQKFHISWALPILMFLIALSGISTASAWLLGPARGLCVAAKQKLFPKWCAYENKKGMPTHILLLQGVVITLLASLFIFLPDANTAFWLLMVMTSQFTLVVYIMIFASAVRLRFKEPHLKRPLHIPGGKISITLLSSMSMLVCAAAIVLGFFPPEQLHILDLKTYETILIIGNSCYVLFPILIYRYSTSKR